MQTKNTIKYDKTNNKSHLVLFRFITSFGQGLVSVSYLLSEIVQQICRIQIVQSYSFFVLILVSPYKPLEPYFVGREGQEHLSLIPFHK
jgi:hypothetical protein